MIELKPCPFCWGEAEIVRKKHKAAPGTVTGRYVRCTKCFAQTVENYVVDDDGAAEEWNKRANLTDICGYTARDGDGKCQSLMERPNDHG